MDCNLKRKETESEEEYIYRICSQKDILGSWSDVADILNDELHTDFSESKFRKSFQAFEKMFNANRSKFINDNAILNEVESKKLELQKEKQKFFDQRTAYNKIVTIRARQEELNEIIETVINNGMLPELNYTPSEIKESDTDMLVSLCDLHYGADINNAWNFYNSDVCRKRLCQYIDEIDSIQNLHKTENCIVWANGDMISGNIHNEISVTNKENVIEQITGVSELIAEFLSELSKRFSTVKFVSVSGNHSRLETKEKSLKDERLDDLVEWYLKARLQNFKNVLIGDYHKLDTTMYYITVRGLNYIGVHGDYDDSDSKIQALKSFVPVQVTGILFGHLHHNSVNTVQGTKTIMAGSFLGMDQYCISKRIYGMPQQLVCILNNKGVKCFYDINF